MPRAGIYVETRIRCELEDVWRLTQQPDLHQQWDLRFTRIKYLPKSRDADPQQFLYETRIGFGLRITGTGESMGERGSPQEGATSSLRFSSTDPKSLIRRGSGYWRYIPTAKGIRFLTWYDYDVRFGSVGKLLDRWAFRPLIGWATAWSFDRLRLWIEHKQPPQTSLMLALIHMMARASIAFVWAWHGLVPKLLFRQIDERLMLSQAGLSATLLPWFGAGELLFAALMLVAWRSRAMFVLNALLMAVTLLAVGLKSPVYFQAAFNPVTLNTAMIALSAIGYIASARIPSGRNCLRSPAQEQN